MNDKLNLAILDRFADFVSCLVDTVLFVGWVRVAGRFLPRLERQDRWRGWYLELKQFLCDLTVLLISYNIDFS